MKRCVILSAGEIADDRFIAALVRPEDYVICADGGYRHAKRLGIRPDLVVGDFDSMEAEEYKDVRHIAYPPQKDDTDTMIAVRHGLERGCRDFLLLGCLGGRFDHSIANLAVLYFLKKRDCTARIVDERNEVFLLENEHIKLPRRHADRRAVSARPLSAGQRVPARREQRVCGRFCGNNGGKRHAFGDSFGRRGTFSRPRRIIKL